MAKNRKAITLRIGRRELATVLAALRFHQDENLQRGGRTIADEAIRQIATDGGLLKPLDFGEVERLCRKINGSRSSCRSPGLTIAGPPRQGGEEPLWRAVYAIDVSTGNPVNAARQAHRIMVDPDSLPPVLDIIDARGAVARIDLSKEEAGQSGAFVHPGIRKVHDLLYLELKDGQEAYNPDKEWTCDTLAAIAEVVAQFIPRPWPDPQDRRTPS